MNFLLENTNLQSENVDAKSFNLCRSMNTVITIRFYLTVNKMGRVTYLEGCIHCRELQEKNEYRYNITQKPTKLKTTNICGSGSLLIFYFCVTDFLLKDIEAFWTISQLKFGN